MKLPTHLQKLSEALKRLPGVGSRSAERFAFQMLTWGPDQLHELGSLVQNLLVKIRKCEECGALIEETCAFCSNESRDKSSLCIVSCYKDLISIENTREFKGIYHVLDSLLSPLDKQGTEKLKLSELSKRIQKHNVKEVLLALDSTLEGDATSFYLKSELENFQLKISRLAFGIPMGSSLEYVDHGTLARALLGRSHF